MAKEEKNNEQPEEPDLPIGPLDVRQIIADMGVRPYLASMAVPTLFLTPGESDPSSQPVMVVVQGIQKCLNELGFTVPRNGLMNAATQSAIQQVAGRNWPAVPWMHIYKLCRRNKRWNLKPMKQVNWKQTQRTAIGEPISLGASVSPLDAAIIYTIPSTSIDCVGGGSSEYCFGKSPTVTTKFKQLQTVLGVAIDGKIGPKTAAAAARKAKELFLDRYSRKLTADEANHLQGVYSAWEKYQRPFVVAASADKTAIIIRKYLGTAGQAVASVKSLVSSMSPDAGSAGTSLVGSGIMNFLTSGYGMVAAAGIGVAAFFIFKPKKKRR